MHIAKPAHPSDRSKLRQQIQQHKQSLANAHTNQYPDPQRSSMPSTITSMTTIIPLTHTQCAHPLLLLPTSPSKPTLPLSLPKNLTLTPLPPYCTLCYESHLSAIRSYHMHIYLTVIKDAVRRGWKRVDVLGTLGDIEAEMEMEVESWRGEGGMRGGR
ncbi:hypothetical protein MMC21_007579 [Puttea exsequens]|nr:hypothetical protein [Puttea exsequens]